MTFAKSVVIKLCKKRITCPNCTNILTGESDLYHNCCLTCDHVWEKKPKIQK